MNEQHESTSPSRGAGSGKKAPPSGGRLWDAVILGAGASGLFCAMTASARGRRVLLVDHAAKAGRKLSITGGGKCNVTNRRVSPGDYRSENPDFCRSALARFTPERLISLLEDAGVSLEEREHGQMFCRRSARDVTRLLVEECRESGCGFAMEERVLAVEPPRPAAESSRDRPTEKEDGLFLVRTSKGLHRARKVVLALGGPAWPQVGATGMGHELARGLGHAIVPVRPALSGLIMPQDWPLAGLAGIALPALVRVLADEADAGPAKGAQGKGGRKKGSAPSEESVLPLLFTHNGISGPAALQASLRWRQGLRLCFDLLPALPEKEGLAPVLDAPGTGKTRCANALKKLLPDRVCKALLPEGIGELRCAELGKSQREALASAFRAHTAAPLRTEGFARAEVAAGGVSTEHISSKSMESALVPGLFFCGEVLDVTGRLGGYNLHWAFASGKAAGEAL